MVKLDLHHHYRIKSIGQALVVFIIYGDFSKEERVRKGNTKNHRIIGDHQYMP